jgi:hypothetical protein
LTHSHQKRPKFDPPIPKKISVYTKSGIFETTTYKKWHFRDPIEKIDVHPLPIINELTLIFIYGWYEKWGYPFIDKNEKLSR